MHSRLIQFAGAFVLTLGLSGCAFTSHKVDLKPQTVTTIAPSSVGQGTTLSFHFSDERDDTTIGVRGAQMMGAKISAENLPSLIEAQLKEGLAKKGYTTVQSDAAANAIVTFRLRAFKFYIETGFWSGDRNASAVLAVDALRGGKSYVHVYRYNSEKRIMFVPGASEIDNQMTAALDQILQQALSDGSFDSFVTGK